MGQLKELKAGNAIKKPIYNHVNGTLDTPEEITPTQIVIVEGLHPMADPRVRELLDFSLYLDITDDVKSRAGSVPGGGRADAAGVSRRRRGVVAPTPRRGRADAAG